MKLPEMTRGRFVRRDNRFRATVSLDGREHWAHVANSGRLRELFHPGAIVWLAPASAGRRKTAYDLKLVQLPTGLVSADARLPNPLLAEAISAGRLPAFTYPEVQREVRSGHSRLDFRLSGPEGDCWIETKSVTLVEAGTALFPDAPTGRGRRHLETLIDLRREGYRAAVIFVIQRPDALRFAPHREADPDFAAALEIAAGAGVEIRAFTCRVSLEDIELADEVPVVWG